MPLKGLALRKLQLVCVCARDLRKHIFNHDLLLTLRYRIKAIKPLALLDVDAGRARELLVKNQTPAACRVIQHQRFGRGHRRARGSSYHIMSLGRTNFVQEFFDLCA